MISSVIWKLGGYSGIDTASTFYINEHGTTVLSGNATTWTGRIGLMYVSDYGFAVGGSVRNKCLTFGLNQYGGCYNNDWLYNGSYQLTLTTQISASKTKGVFLTYPGNINARYINELYTIRPTLHLNSNIEIIADETHDGSQEHPYELKLAS